MTKIEELEFLIKDYFDAMDYMTLLNSKRKMEKDILKLIEEIKSEQSRSD